MMSIRGLTFDAPAEESHAHKRIAGKNKGAIKNVPVPSTTKGK